MHIHWGTVFLFVIGLAASSGSGAASDLEGKAVSLSEQEEYYLSFVDQIHSAVPHDPEAFQLRGYPEPAQFFAYGDKAFEYRQFRCRRGASFDFESGFGTGTIRVGLCQQGEEIPSDVVSSAQARLLGLADSPRFAKVYEVFGGHHQRTMEGGVELHRFPTFLLGGHGAMFLHTAIAYSPDSNYVAVAQFGGEGLCKSPQEEAPLCGGRDQTLAVLVKELLARPLSEQPPPLPSTEHGVAEPSEKPQAGQHEEASRNAAEREERGGGDPVTDEDSAASGASAMGGQRSPDGGAKRLEYKAPPGGSPGMATAAGRADREADSDEPRRLREWGKRSDRNGFEAAETE